MSENPEQDSKPYDKENMTCLFTTKDWEDWEKINARTRIREELPTPIQLSILKFIEKNNGKYNAHSAAKALGKNNAIDASSLSYHGWINYDIYKKPRRLFISENGRRILKRMEEIQREIK